MQNNYQKKNIAEDLSNKTGYSLNYSKKLVSDIVECVINNTKIDGIYLKNLGLFKVVNKKKSIGRNPKTKKEYIIYPKKILKFIPSNNLKINSIIK